VSAHTKSPSFAYLLLTHKDARHVEGLAHRILDLSPRAQIVVHHDAGAGDTPWRGQPSGPIHLVERGRVSWGDWSMIEATLRMIRYAVDCLEADWFVLLSGEHRPTVVLQEWEERTAALGTDALLAAEPLPSRLRWGASDFDRNQYLARSLHRWSLVDRPRYDIAHRGMGLLMKLSTRLRPVVSIEYVHRREAWALGRPRQPHALRGWTFYRGSQWFALNRRAAQAALVIDRAVAGWFAQSWIPDETYLQTALRHVPGLDIADSLTTFVLDTPAHPYPGWMQLSPEDVPAAMASGLPFARKVDLAARPDVVATIDRAVDHHRDSARGDSTTARSRASNRAPGT
jgi:hypothetical protein